MTLKHFDSENNNRKFELPGAKPHYNPDRYGQVNHIFLDLTLDIPHQSFTGTCAITLTPVRSGINQLILDAVDLNINSVFINKVSQPFDYDKEKLTINLLQPTQENPITIIINYGVENPQRGLYFIAPNEHYPDKPTQVWTQGEDEDSRFWFPCFDYPGQLATSEIKVKVPNNFMAISNGELINQETVGEETIYHWSQKQIHPTYLMTLAVGEFSEIKDQWKGIPVNYYVEKGKEEEANLSMGKTPQMIDYFSSKFGYDYPYPKYTQVCVNDFIFGGMENTSTTLLTDRCLLDEKALNDRPFTESLVAHELAHQWFGDLVVIKHWSHAWIKEGMASYSEVLWTEHEYGKDDAAYYLLNEARSYLEEDSSRYRRPIVTNIYREAIELYDRHLYEKGACVYHMIRGILGDELFDKAIHRFVNENAHKTVETIDLLRAIETSTGYNLLFLFDQYVFRGGHPDYKINYSWDNDNNLAKLTITQTQVTEEEGNSKDSFDLKIPIGFGYKNSAMKTFTLRIHEKQQSFYFPLESKPDYISFDVNNYFLKTVELDYPIAELKAQLSHDPDPISRTYAAIAIGKKGNLEAIKSLEEALIKDSFWGVRLEAAKQLGKISLDQAGEALQKGLSDDNAKVRRAVIESLGNIKNNYCYETLKTCLETENTSYYCEAAIARSLGSILSGNLKEKTPEVIDLLKNILETRSGWNEVVRSGAIGGLSQLKTNPDAVDVIFEYTKLGIPQALRLAAIRALGSISTGQTPNKLEEILEILEAISQETFFLTQVAATIALGQMETPKAVTILQGLADRTPDGRVKRKAEEAIKKVQKKLGSDKGMQSLRDELEKLKQENQDLQSRIANLEAKNGQAK
ncbi:aminopeptidase N [Crocosphaera subtropica ATCC 51142]|uniref:Aminopeptidase N n=1 Tax=Crocosphaera subtropica (strain ATCC 51142 / BH68) TaxID=43989 RepID=B1WZD0_CROS5|nr:M1 family metallopeptidase [Crocosphaera subtropica]ACB49496.1 aminopeptidase N [Crocosphaera subtropica ATCC 51142]